jgi:aminoglycoside phosphotransferase (APT) family kinase protein
LSVLPDVSESELSLSGWPHSADEVREAVAAVLPEVAVRDASGVEEGRNTVYFVTADGFAGADSAGSDPGAEDADHPDLVLKVGTHHFAAGCRAEPHVLDAVAERTGIPVPEVYGTGHLREDPYFLAEYVPCVNPSTDFERLGPHCLAPETFERICVEAGRNLGELHDAFPADSWGMLGVERGADDLELVRAFPDWPSYCEAWLTHSVERLADTRFVDLVPALEERVASVADELREYGPFDPVMSHGDYRLGNLVLDPDATPVTAAVLDWATPTAVSPVHDLAVTEAVLLDWPAFDADRQRHLRERFYDGYRERNAGVLDRDGFEAHRHLCRFGARLRLMVNLRDEMAGRSEAAVDARACEHREALDEWGVA